MRPTVLLLPLGLLLTGCPVQEIRPPERVAPQVIRVAVPADPALADRLEASLAGVAGIVRVPSGDRPIDVEVVYGQPDPPAGMVATPIPSWDRSWFLELDPTARWVNDPNFRHWLAMRIDRAGMARVLFGEGAVPILSGHQEAGRRPVSSGAMPRLQILRGSDSPSAYRIVSRLRADLLPEQVLVEPIEESRDRAVALRLVDHDPDHGGTETDTVIPLIREKAFLLVRTGLSGIAASPSGALLFENARWTP